MVDKPRKSLSLSLSPPAIPVAVWRVIAFGGFANFAAFLLATYALGGDAINGVIQEGAFFLGSHGQYTQVSELIYRLSYLHGVTAVIGVLAGALGAWRLESRGDPVFRRWNRPLGRMLVATVFSAIAAWSFGVPARWGVPVALLIGGACVALPPGQHADRPSDDRVA